MNKTIAVIGGGTIFHVRPHLALSAIAYGTTARTLYNLCRGIRHLHSADVQLYLTKMASQSSQIETNQDVEELVNELLNKEEIKIIFFNPALVDYVGVIKDSTGIDGKYGTRLETSEGSQTMSLIPSKKVLADIKDKRPDITLIAFKTTSGALEEEQITKAKILIDKSNCDYVLANDTKTRTNIIVSANSIKDPITITDRQKALGVLVDMAVLDSQ